MGTSLPGMHAAFGRDSKEERTLLSPVLGQEGRKEHCQDIAGHRGRGSAKKG